MVSGYLMRRLRSLAEAMADIEQAKAGVRRATEPASQSQAAEVEISTPQEETCAARGNEAGPSGFEN